MLHTEKAIEPPRPMCGLSSRRKPLASTCTQGSRSTTDSNLFLFCIVIVLSPEVRRNDLVGGVIFRLPGSNLDSREATGLQLTACPSIPGRVACAHTTSKVTYIFVVVIPKGAIFNPLS